MKRMFLSGFSKICDFYLDRDRRRRLSPVTERQWQWPLRQWQCWDSPVSTWSTCRSSRCSCRSYLGWDSWCRLAPWAVWELGHRLENSKTQESENGWLWNRNISSSSDNSDLSVQPFSTCCHDEQLRCLEIWSSIDPTAAHGGHDHVPAEGDRVLVFPDSVVLGQAVLQESFRAQICLRLPDSDEYYEGNLQSRITILSSERLSFTLRITWRQKMMRRKIP